MKRVSVLRDKKELCKAIHCNNMLTRSLGLMLRTPKPALIELPFESREMAGIHTFFMRFSIDVAWLNKEGKILAVKRGIRPFRLAPCPKPAKYIFEAPAGVIILKEGQKLAFKPAEHLRKL